MEKEKNPNTKNNDYTEITSEKEINATLDMVIRTLANLDKIRNTDNEKSEQNNNDSTENCDSEEKINSKSRKKDAGFELDINTRYVTRPELTFFLTCVDLFIFELDDEVIEKLIFCAILSMTLSKFLDRVKCACLLPKSIALRVEKQLDKKVTDIYNQFLLKVMNGVQTADNKKDYVQNLFQNVKFDSENNKDLNDLFAANLQNLFDSNNDTSVDVEEIQKQFELRIRAEALSFLSENFTCKFVEFQRAVNLKVKRVKLDLRFLSQEIIRLTKSEQGIVQLAEALFKVTSARFAEEDNFNEIFDAVEEVADAIEELAEIYQDRLKVLRALLPFSNPLLLSINRSNIIDECSDIIDKCSEVIDDSD